MFRCRNGFTVKMRHVRTPALWLVVLSSWAAGYPTASPAGNTTGPTRIELLAARSQHHAPTAADKRENAELHHGVSASPAVGIQPTYGVLSPLLLTGLHRLLVRMATGSIPDEVTEFFDWTNLSSLGSTQSLPGMSTRNLPGGGGGGA
jgi:hypothetical protein